VGSADRARFPIPDSLFPIPRSMTPIWRGDLESQPRLIRLIASVVVKFSQNKISPGLEVHCDRAGSPDHSNEVSTPHKFRPRQDH
jgi:hypothetical protein